MSIAKTLDWHIYKSDAGSSFSSQSSHEDLIAKIVYGLTSFTYKPWVLRGSSNGVVAALDGVNRIPNGDSIIWATAGTAHSWVVIKEPVSGVQICFDFSILYNDAWGPNITLYTSYSSGFTGGTTTARPTAVDEFGGTLRWLGTTERDSHFKGKLIIWRDYTGYSTRVVFMNNGIPMLLWCFETLQSPQTAITFAIGNVADNTDFTSNKIDVTFSSKGRLFYTKYSGTLYQGCLAIRQHNSVPIVKNLTMNPTNHSFFIDAPVVMLGPNENDQNRVGYLYDFYFAPTLNSTGAIYDDSNLDWVQIGDALFPWDNSIFRKV